MSPEVFSLRETFMQQQIMLCFNGPFTAGLIDEIGKALRNHLQSLAESSAAVSDVFSVYIEMTQNIRNYTLAHNLTDDAAISTIIVSRTSDGHYIVSAGNVVQPDDGRQLQEKIAELAVLDKAELKTRFKTQLRQPRTELEGRGAGLGLIDMARKASQPLVAELRPLDEQRAFFSLRVVL